MARRPHRHRQKHAVHVTTCPAHPVNHASLANTNPEPALQHLASGKHNAQRQANTSMGLPAAQQEAV